MITATWQDGMKGFDFLYAQYNQPNNIPIVLTQAEWKKCLSEWPLRYMTGGSYYQQHSRTWLDRLLRRPAKITVTGMQIDGETLIKIRREMESCQALLCNGQYRKVVIR